MYLDKAIGEVTPAGRKVGEQIIQLALPYWMWVSWSSWEGRIDNSNMGTLCRAPELATVAISNIGLLEQKLKNYFGAFSFAAMLSFEWCYIIAFAACEAVW